MLNFNGKKKYISIYINPFDIEMAFEILLIKYEFQMLL